MHAVRPGVPPAVVGTPFDEVVRAWQGARQVGDPREPQLAAALRAFARDARARGLDVTLALQALNTLAQPETRGTPTRDWDHVRTIAGTTVISAYYAATDHAATHAEH